MQYTFFNSDASQTIQLSAFNRMSNAKRKPNRIQSILRDAPKLLLVMMWVLILSCNISAALGKHEVTIYFNGGCPVCVSYVGTLERALNSENTAEITKFDYNIDPKVLDSLAVLRKRLDVPADFYGIVTTIVDGKYVFEGYFPIDVMIRFITSGSSLDRLVVSEGFRPDVYRLYKDRSTIECSTSQSITDCALSGQLFDTAGILTLVLISGFVDGLNPCAFAVLAYFLGVVLLNQSRKRVLIVGAFYVLSVYLIYLAIGLGMIRLILVTGLVRLASRVLGGFIIGLSLLSLINAIRRSHDIPLKLPRESILSIATKLPSSWIQKSPIVAALLFGGIVTALEFPCTGGIYAAIMGTLAVHGTDASQVAYLLLYNLMFVLPLVILLISLSTIARFRRIMNAMERHRYVFEAMSALFMLGIGVFLLL